MLHDPGAYVTYTLLDRLRGQIGISQSFCPQLCKGFIWVFAYLRVL